jgi:hypothetical protein
MENDLPVQKPRIYRSIRVNAIEASIKGNIIVAIVLIHPDELGGSRR